MYVHTYIYIYIYLFIYLIYLLTYHIWVFIVECSRAPVINGCFTRKQRQISTPGSQAMICIAAHLKDAMSLFMADDEISSKLAPLCCCWLCSTACRTNRTAEKN